MIYFRRHWVLLLALLGLVFLAYCNVYFFEFLYDDEFFIQKNSFLTSFTKIPEIFTHSLTGGAGFSDSFYRPLQAVFYLFIYQSVGLETWPFHLLNVTIHAANALLIFGLALRMGLARGFAFAAAALWGLHPIHVECITYMSGTADSLHAFFMLAALYLMTPDFTLRKLAAGLVFFVLALLSKESAIVMPAVLVSMLFFFSDRRWYWRTYIKTLPFWGVAALYLVARKTILNFDQDFSFFKTENIYTENILYRLYTFLATLPNYLKILFWPTDLHIDRAFPVYTQFWTVEVVFGAVISLLAAAVLIKAILARPQWVWPAWMVLWFAAAHAPHAGVLMPMNSFFLEHWMYTPSMALFIGLAAGTQWLTEPRPQLHKPLAAAAVIIAVALGAKTFFQNRVWSDPVTLYSHILSLSPEIARVRHNLAMSYGERGDHEKALEQYQIALKTGSTYPQIYHNMGNSYLALGKDELAEQHFLKALELSPRFFPSLAALTNFYLKKGDIPKSEEYRKRYNEATAK